MRPYSYYPVQLGYFSNTKGETIELTPNHYGPDPKYRDLAKEWGAFRESQLQAFLGTLDTPLKTLSIPCYAPSPYPGMTGLWKVPDLSHLAGVESQGNDFPFVLRQTRKLSPVALRHVVVEGKRQREDFQRELRLLSASDAGAEHADGIVLDLSLVPLDEAKRLLDGLNL